MAVELLNPVVAETPVYNASGQRLRKLSLILDETGEGQGCTVGPGDGVGAMQSQNVDIVGDALTESYIAQSLKRDKPTFHPSLIQHDGHMVIVGSGPSVADHIAEIKDYQSLGRPVMAIKGAHDWLIDRGITPDLWVSMDSQDKIIEGVRKKSHRTCYMLASKVSPVVYDWLADQQVVMWHAWYGKKNEASFPKDSVLVGGGSTSGFRGITLAWLMGFRRIYLYGFDSCLKDGAKRVNGDKPDQKWTLTIQASPAAPERVCDGAMASQAAEFEPMVFHAMPGIKVKVVGDGLLADIMAERQRLGFVDW